MHVASAYTMEVRYFLCPSCGAPIDVSPAGGTAKCRFCSVQSHVAPRGAHVPLPAPRMSEAERLKVLFAQANDKKLSPPTRLERLFSRGSATGLWNREEVLAAWQSARKRTTEKHHDAAEELLFLTLVLGNELVEKHDWIGHRALLESAFEAFFLPQHRSVVASDMATGAARQNDLAGAKVWLAQCDPISEVLYADSHFRSARAAVAHVESNYRDVLVTLGMKTGEVPIHASLRDVCTVSRAHALEQMGALPDAIHELELRMGQGPQERRAVESIAALRSRCARSLPIASAAVRQRASIVAANTAGGVEPTGFSALFGGGRDARSAAAAETARRLAIEGIDAHGAVLSITNTGVVIDDKPLQRFHLRVEIDHSTVPPYEAYLDLLLTDETVAPLRGGFMFLLVDRNDPRIIASEAWAGAPTDD